MRDGYYNIYVYKGRTLRGGSSHVTREDSINAAFQYGLKANSFKLNSRIKVTLKPSPYPLGAYRQEVTL